MLQHIVLFTLSLRSGGTERHVANLALTLHKNGRRVSVVTIFPDRTPLTGELAAAGVALYLDWFTGRLGYVMGILRASRFMRSAQVSLVHVFLMAALPFAMAAKLLSGVPVCIVSERTCRRPLWPGRRVWLYRFLLRFVQLIETNSEAAREILITDEKIAPQRIVVHHNMLRTERFEPLPQPPQEAWVVKGRLRVGNVAHLRIEKNVLLLARAVEPLIREYPLLDVIHAGIPYEAKTAGEVASFAQQRLGSRWIALGGRNDIPAVLSALDIFVLCSDFEGLPNAMLEAMACGLPVVATNFSDSNVLLQGGRGGIVVPVGDDRALADALRQLLDNPELRRSMGQANREWVFSRLKPESVVHEVEMMYDDLLRRYAKQP